MALSKRLIEVDSKGKLIVDEEGLRLISDINEEYGLVTISAIGPGRTGKSTLLNMFLGCVAFKVGSTTDVVTKGVWIAVHIDHANKRAVIYLDVEGSGNIKQTEEADFKLLLLVSQFSDVILYNTKGTIDRDISKKLSSIDDVFNRYRKGNNFLTNPSLLVVLRDFSLDIPNDPDMELRDLISQSSELEHIGKTFRKMKVFLFPRPTEDENLSQLSATSDTLLKEKFMKVRNDIKEYLNCEAKPLCGGEQRLIHKNVFAEAVSKTVEQLNGDNLGTLNETLSASLIRENLTLKKEAFDNYSLEMLTKWPSDSDPTPEHKRLQTSMKELLGKKLYDVNGKVQLLEQFEENTKQGFESLSEKKSKETLKYLKQDVQTKVDDDYYVKKGNSGEYKKDIEDVKRKYKAKKNLGPKATDVWDKYESVQNKKINDLIKEEKAKTWEKVKEVTGVLIGVAAVVGMVMNKK